MNGICRVCGKLEKRRHRHDRDVALRLRIAHSEAEQQARWIAQLVRQARAREGLPN